MSKALHLLEHALGLRVALDFLDKALLMTLLKCPDAAGSPPARSP